MTVFANYKAGIQCKAKIVLQSNLGAIILYKDFDSLSTISDILLERMSVH